MFNSFQRKQYFDFPQAIQQVDERLRTASNQICFLLGCGYFKASTIFSSFINIQPFFLNTLI